MFTHRTSVTNPRSTPNALLQGLILWFACLAFSLSAANYKPILIDPTYEHDRWNTKPKDIVRIFEAYMVSFDGEDDDAIGDKRSDLLGIPDWVAYEVRAVEDDLGAGPKRPKPWLHDVNLAARKVAPKDETYSGSGYHRGHLCQKYIAWRLGTNADWNTHTTMNACPQLPDFNAGIWLDLEELTQRWADEYGKIWVVCGPIVTNKANLKWIGEEAEDQIRAVVPDAFFKIVIKQKSAKRNPDVLAFIYPHKAIKKGADGHFDHKAYLVSVDDVEKASGLDFLTALPDADEEAIEKAKPAELWPVSE